MFNLTNFLAMLPILAILIAFIYCVVDIVKAFEEFFQQQKHINYILRSKK